MSNSNGIISKPIDLKADIATVLGESSTDLGTLCKSGAINKFSKVKPIVYPSVTELTDAQRKSKRYGLTILGGGHGTMNTGHTPWAYNRPTGGSSSPYRMSDFANYNHAATNPVKSVVWPDRMVTNGTSTSPNFSVTVPFRRSSEDNSMLGLDDLFDTSCYLAVILVSGTTYYAATSPMTLAQALSIMPSNCAIGADVPIGNTSFKTGFDGKQITAIVCLADRQITENNDNPTQATFYSLEGVEGCDRKNFTLTKVYWCDGMKFTLTQDVTKTVNSSTGFVFKINSLKVKIEAPDEFSQIRPTFHIKAFLRVVDSGTGKATYYGFEQSTVTSSSLPKTITLSTGSSSTEYKSTYNSPNSQFMLGIRVGINDMGDTTENGGSDPNGSLEVVRIHNSTGTTNWNTTTPVYADYGTKATLG